MIGHRTKGFESDLACEVAREVPLVITLLGATRDIARAVHGHGGVVFHDVTSRCHTGKAAEAGVEGITAIAVGAGGHVGTVSPFAPVVRIRVILADTILPGGAIEDRRAAGEICRRSIGALCAGAAGPVAREKERA